MDWELLQCIERKKKEKGERGRQRERTREARREDPKPCSWEGGAQDGRGEAHAVGRGRGLADDGEKRGAGERAELADVALEPVPEGRERSFGWKAERRNVLLIERESFR